MNQFAQLLSKAVRKDSLYTLTAKTHFNIPLLTEKKYLRALPYVEREQIDCPCGGDGLFGWSVINGENVPGIFCIDCGYTQVQMSDMIDHEVLLPDMLKDMAIALGLRLTACEERWPGLWMIGTLNGVDFYFVTDYKDTVFLKIARSFTGRAKALFFTIDDPSAKKLADFALGYPCAPVELVLGFDSDYNIRLCHNKQLINSHFYRGVSELPYKLLFAVIYTHLEFRYEVSHTITSHHVHHFHQTRIPDGTLLDYMVQYRKPLFPQFFLYPKKFLPENNPHHKEFHLRPYIQNNANQ